MSVDPVDVTPLSVDPAAIVSPLRRRAHQARCDVQYAADDARSRVVGALTDGGVAEREAADLVDGLIAAVRTADAARLEYARSTQDGPGRTHWRGVDDLNGAVDFLRRTAHAYPVRGE